jgi:hypothetical protein
MWTEQCQNVNFNIQHVSIVYHMLILFLCTTCLYIVLCATCLSCVFCLHHANIVVVYHVLILCLCIACLYCFVYHMLILFLCTTCVLCFLCMILIVCITFLYGVCTMATCMHILFLCTTYLYCFNCLRQNTCSYGKISNIIIWISNFMFNIMLYNSVIVQGDTYSKCHLLTSRL